MAHGSSLVRSVGGNVRSSVVIKTPDLRFEKIKREADGLWAANETLALILAMRRTGISGVALKDALDQLGGPSGLRASTAPIERLLQSDGR